MCRSVRIAWAAFACTACSSAVETRTTLAAPSISYDVIDAPSVMIECGRLRAVLANNRPAPPDHRAGYNGLVELSYDGKPSPFVRQYAGVNLEHVNNGVAYADRDLQFEPRRHSMQLRRIDSTTYDLWQSALPNTGVESCTRFALRPPHSIDVTFECVPRKSAFPHHHVSFFWASYIAKPDSKSVWFLGRRKGASGERWIEGVTPRHGVRATHRSAGDGRRFSRDEPFPLTLVFNESDYEYTRAFYYGRYRDLVWIAMFDPDDLVRFTQSPSGGGRDNPAWDFQWFVDRPRANRAYRLEFRVVLKPWAGRDDVLREYQAWRKTTGR